MKRTSAPDQEPVYRRALDEEVWGYEQSGNVMEAHMSALRRKLEAQGDRCIHTVRAVGYVLRPTGGRTALRIGIR